MNVIIRLWRHNIMTNFLTGLVILLPIMLTFIIIAWIVDFVATAIGPGSYLGAVLTQGGMAITGSNYKTLAFLLGAGAALAGIFFLGMFARSAAQRSIQEMVDRIFTKMPLVRAIYNPISRVVRLTTDKNTDFSAMSVVVCRIGGVEGTDVLALLANQEVYSILGERRRMVFLPFAPFPMSGGLLMVPEHAVQPVPEMKVEDLLRVYFSVGALAPDSMPKYLKADPLPQGVLVVPPVQMAPLSPAPASENGAAE